jgi:uncharacterized RmlC-like cupin family protein
VDDAVETFRVIRGRSEDPNAPDGLALFASMLGDGSSPTRFPVVLPPGTHLATHRHTAELAAAVISGSVTFVFGADGAGREELGPGDYIWLHEGVMHDEETADGVELVVAHVSSFETLSD